MTQRPREWLKFSGLLAVTVLVGLAFMGVADYRPSSALQRVEGLPELQEAAVAPASRPLPAAQPAADLSEAFAATAEAVRSAVVFIRAESRAVVPRGFERLLPQGQQPPRRRGDGSGFLISADGYILTNNHVVENAEEITVRLLDRREFPARVVGTDPATDVAVIKIEGNAFPHVTLGNSDAVRVGEWVLAVGNPLGEDFSFTVTAGIVSAKGRVLNGLPQRRSEYSIMDFIQTDAVINPGNSGGPLVNLSGQVVGINSAIASESGFYQGYGFAIPMNLARNVADQLIRSGHVTRAILGVQIDDVAPEDAEYVGLDEISGVVVESFSTEDSPARRAGIEIGDVIIALNGEPVRYIAQLQQRVGFMRPGETVEVTLVRRGGERHTVRVRLAEAPVTQQVASRQLEEPVSQGAPTHAKLGLALRPVAPNTTIGNQIVGEEGAGLGIVSKDPDGPAARRLVAWGEPGGPDIITHVNGTRVRTMEDFNAQVDGRQAGEIVSLQIWNPSVGQRRVERIRLR